jgi:drug/metabolite transporter (DMT)-like permease
LLNEKADSSRPFYLAIPTTKVESLYFYETGDNRAFLKDFLMSRLRLAAATSLAMIAFAGNSLLCRMALKQTHIDAATFTTVRIASGALALWLIVRLRAGFPRGSGSWTSASVLMAYAVCFSLAYISLPAATGALLLFGAVQVTMIGYGLAAGERLRAIGAIGAVCAFGGLIVLVLPGVAAPSLIGSALMLAAGVAWGIYSLLGKRASGDPTRTTAGNFVRAIPITCLFSVCALPWLSIDGIGIAYAVASGAITSGVGYAIWYTALPGLQATQAGIVQLSVPLIAALGGIILLGEPVSVRIGIAAIAILGGIALVIVGKKRR